MANVTYMALLAGIVFPGAVCAQDVTNSPNFKTVRAPQYDHFVFGVFMDSSKERTMTVPLTKVFTDFLTHGIELVGIGTENHSTLMSQNINTFAKANGVRLVRWLPGPEPLDAATKCDERELRNVIKSNVDYINSLPDSDAVVAWRIADEAESMNWGQKDMMPKRALMDQNLQRWSELIREIDPKRYVVINHAYMPVPADHWLTAHEDEAWSSTGMTGIYNAYRVKEQIAEARSHGLSNYILVAQAQTCPLGEANIRWYGHNAPINDEVIKSRTEGQTMQDYAEVAFTQGAAGINYFLYWAGGDNYDELSLVDLNGNDYRGKWDGVKKAAQNIRRWEGAPSCSINSPAGWTQLPFTVTVNTSAPTNDPVTVVKADYSLDGAAHWLPLPDATEKPYAFTVMADMVKNTPSTVWVRTRAFNKRGASLWDVLERRCCKKD